MSNKSTIIPLIIFLALSCIFLSYTQTKQQSPQSQNWWVIYFANPKDESLNFVIENNSDQTNFHYEILSDKEKIKEADIKIDKGVKKEIPIDINAAGNKKITIQVNVSDDKKEIYKNIGN